MSSNSREKDRTVHKKQRAREAPVKLSLLEISRESLASAELAVITAAVGAAETAAELLML